MFDILNLKKNQVRDLLVGSVLRSESVAVPLG
jgi:hypothetical protein